MSYQAPSLPSVFIWRRLHSLTGFWIVLFLCEHLLVNSQAALFIGDDGSGFVRMVDSIKNLPYLPVIELTLLGVPFLIHMVWGVQYLRTAKFISSSSDGSLPAVPYARNRAYTWQRITSWVLLVGIAAHVIQMRFVDYPDKVEMGLTDQYMVRLQMDAGLYTVADRLHVKLYDAAAITDAQARLERQESFALPPPSNKFDPTVADTLAHEQAAKQYATWIKAMQKYALKEGEVIAVAPRFGTAVLLSVRNTFKSPLMVALYALFVVAACFHGFNGLWTFLISWGVTLTVKSQKWMGGISVALMILLSFLGLAAVFGTYWINLRY